MFGEPKKRGMGLIVEETSDDASVCDKRTIQACVMYSGPDNFSNMALLQVSMVSGKCEDSLPRYPFFNDII